MEQILNHRLGDVAQSSSTADEGIATEDSNGYRSKKRKLFVYKRVRLWRVTFIKQNLEAGFVHYLRSAFSKHFRREYISPYTQETQIIAPERF